MSEHRDSFHLYLNSDADKSAGSTNTASDFVVPLTTPLALDPNRDWQVGVKEMVIPNKELITGRVLNWTLSSKLNRVMINVGVAYGSDTGQARDLLLKVAREHPLVLDDPEPSTREAVAASLAGCADREFVAKPARAG